MPIRQQRPLSDIFAKEFENSISDSPVPLSELIRWDEIESRVNRKLNILPILTHSDSPEEFFKQEFVEHEKAARRCEILFELLNFSNEKLSSREKTWNLSEINFSKPHSVKKERLARHLVEIKAYRLFRSPEILEGHLEQHEVRAFRLTPQREEEYLHKSFGNELKSILIEKSENFEVETEERAVDEPMSDIKYFDYVVSYNDEPKIVFQLDYFKRKSSKIHELIQSYDRISTKLRNENIEFVWVIEGKGFDIKTIQDAYESIVDIYNMNQIEDILKDDITMFLNRGAAVNEDEINLSPNTNLQDFK